MFDGDVIEFLENYTQKGSDYGVERTAELIKLLGCPDRKLKIIHIAGTNGKGSTAAYMSQILTAAGIKTGTFNSPKVIDYCGQFLVDCKPLPRQKLQRYFERALKCAESMESFPTAFEIETAGALYAFASEGCEYAVVECGLGGLLDATNAIARKQMALITSISMEHTQILGDTLQKICAQKAGIIKDCPAIVSGLQPKEAEEFFKDLGAIICRPQITGLSDGVEFIYKGERYKTPMHGSAQAYNAALAIECALRLNIPESFIKTGISRTQPVGRVQIMRLKSRTYILDGSHNPASFAPLTETLSSFAGRKSLVFGCLSDKDVFAAAEILCGIFDEIFTFPPASYRAMDADKLNSAMGGTRASGVEDALNRATGDVVAVCGSFVNISEAMQWIEKRQ